MKNQNGGAQNADPFKDKEIEYPVSFELKAVMVMEENAGDNKKKLEAVFTKQKVKNQFISDKISSKSTYISYTYGITLTSKGQMESMYNDLKKVKGLKFAL